MDDKPLIWITGANGFLGTYISRAFEQDGWRVVGTERPKREIQGSEAGRVFPVSLETSGLRTLLQRTGPPTAVFHAAGSGTVGETINDPRRGFLDTVGTAFEMIQFLIAHCPEAVFIYPSSCSVYGDRPSGAIPEETPTRPTSPYGAYKAMVEALCHSAALGCGLRTGLIRYFSVYGPGQRKQLLWDVCRRSIQGAPIIELSGTGTETRDFLYVEDAAQFSVLIAHHLLSGDAEVEPLIVNGGTGQARTIGEIVCSVVSMLGIELEVRFTGIPRPGDPQHFEASPLKSSALGFAPQWAYEDGIRDYCRWFRASCRDQLHTVDAQ